MQHRQLDGQHRRRKIRPAGDPRQQRQQPELQGDAGHTHGIESKPAPDVRTNCAVTHTWKASNGRQDGSRPEPLAAGLQLIERARPVVLEQPGQGPIGQQPPAGLAAAAVVGLVAARRRCAGSASRRQGTACRSGRGPPSPSRNAVTFSGKRDARLRRSGARSTSPAWRAWPRTAGRSRHASGCDGQLHRRQPRGVQDLVRVGVADAAEDVRIGRAPA